MKPVKLLLLFVSIFCFYSCESAMNKSEQSEIDIESDEMRISESSVDAVLSFVKDVYPQKYKTLSLTKEVLKIEYVTNVLYERNKFFAPSADNANRELDTLLCVINFGNDEGFAIVSTQDNQILAVTESGDLSVEDLTIEYTNEDFENNPKAVISNYVANYMSQKVTIEESLKNDNLSGYERAALVTKSAELNGELAERKVRFNRWYNIYSDNTIYDNVEPINFNTSGDNDG